MGAAATSSEADFSSLSLKDLVEAQDLYQFHLMNHPNVVVGLRTHTPGANCAVSPVPPHQSSAPESSPER